VARLWESLSPWLYQAGATSGWFHDEYRLDKDFAEPCSWWWRYCDFSRPGLLHESRTEDVAGVTKSLHASAATCQWSAATHDQKLVALQKQKLGK
jgi:hypothetical protein